MPYIKPALDSESGLTVTLSQCDSPIIRDLGNGLLVLYVVDAGESLEFVQNRHLSAAGIDADALHATAMDNLLRFIAERTRMQPQGNIFALFVDGNFEASLLLADPLWDESLAGYAPNGFVIAVPARDVLAFTDAGSAAGLEELRRVVSRVFPGGDHLITPDLYQRHSGRWVRFSAERNPVPDRGVR
jgi:uncharacterized protein YtpQ (UPF0354 family)